MRRLLALVGSGLLLAAGLPAAGPPAAAAPTVQQRQVHTYRFTGSGESILYIKGTLLARGAPAVLSVVFTDDDVRTGRPRALMWGDVYEFGGQGTGGYGAADAFDCAAPLQCRAEADGPELPFSVFLEFDAPAPVRFTVHIVTQGAKVTVRDRILERWKAAHRTGGYRTVAAESADAHGATSNGQRVEVFRGAAAPGGRRGSVAVAVPPCSPGFGRLRLDGGRAPVDLDCGATDVVAFADRATTWRLSGLMAGSAVESTRLLVIDR